MTDRAKTILLVDDESLMLEMIRLYLGKKGYRLFEAENAADAMALFLEHQDAINLLLLDIRMPRKDGLDLYEEISRIRPDIPVIFMGGDVEHHRDDRRISGKNANFLPKPFSPQTLVNKIHEVLTP